MLVLTQLVCGSPYVRQKDEARKELFRIASEYQMLAPPNSWDARDIMLLLMPALLCSASAWNMSTVTRAVVSQKNALSGWVGM
jgi:hypothetical protein